MTKVLDSIYNEKRIAEKEISYWVNCKVKLEQGKGCLPYQWRLRIYLIK